MFSPIVSGLHISDLSSFPLPTVCSFSNILKRKQTKVYKAEGIDLWQHFVSLIQNSFHVL